MAVIVLLETVTAKGAETADFFIRGIVRDSITDQTIPNAIVTFDDGRRGTMADSRGIFELTVPAGGAKLSVRCQGYATKQIDVTKNRVNLYAVYLAPEAVELAEVVVRKKKYSKRNNPAVDLMQHVRRTARVNDPTTRPYYNYRTYQRISLALNNIDASGDKGIVRRFPFLAEHLDTSAVTGKPILPISVREQVTDVYNRMSPQSRHTIVTAKRSDGIDQMLDRESMDRFMNDVMGPVDIYARDINILQNRFVSPLSPIAADFYKYYLTDSLTDPADGRRYYVLSFYPHNKAAFGFTGTLEVTRTDTSAFVRSVEMRVPSEINLNFVESMYIRQTFGTADDGSRLPLTDEMTIEAVIIPGTQGLYARRTIDYTGHNFERPANELAIFAPRAPVTVSADALSRDSTFWASVNPAGLPRGESGIGRMLTRLRKEPVYYWGEKVLKVLVTGYIPTRASDSRFDIGPVNTTISSNPLEGLRLRTGGMTTAALSPHLFTRFYGAYGFKDHKWKYGVELEWSFNRKERHSREFPIHSLRINSTYDVDRPGQHYLYTNPDNFFLSLRRPGIDPLTYHRLNSLTYTLELPTHFSVTAAITNERQYATSRMPFDLSGGGSLHHYDNTWADIELRYAPGETFYQTASNRFPISLDQPVFILTHRYAPSGIAGRGTGLNITRASVRKRFWLSAFGYVDILVTGGHVWSRHTPFNHLFAANTNLSYTIQPESFALTAPMEFVADTYGSADLTYWANGALLNMVPVVKRLKLREVVGIKTFWGHLSQRNDPAATTGLITWTGYEDVAQRLRTPYVEASVGIDNILRCLRVDYVWRLTHRDTPLYGASRRGVRIAFHATF